MREGGAQSPHTPCMRATFSPVSRSSWLVSGLLPAARRVAPHSAHSCECARTLCHYPTQQRTPRSGRSPAMKAVLPLPRGDSPSCPFPLQTFTISTSFEQVLPLADCSFQAARPPCPPGLILEKCPHGWLRDLSPSSPELQGIGNDAIPADVHCKDLENSDK